MTMCQPEYDTLVIGAGPAGCELAYQLAAEGLKVLVLEKARLDREKPCGGGIQLQELREFDALPEDVIERTIKRAVIVTPQNKVLEIVDPTTKDFSVTVKRSVYDGYLQQRSRQAGAVFLERTRVTAIRQNSAAAVVTAVTDNGPTTFSARLVVNAAGSSAFHLTRQLGIRDVLTDLVVTRDVWVEIPEIEERFKDAIELYYLKENPRGYAWAFPKRDVVSVGVGATLESIRRTGLDLDALLGRFLDEHPIASTKLRGYRVVKKDRGLIRFGIPPQLWSARGIVLGDAGGFANLIHGGGIYQARKSATIAAPFCRQFLQTGRESFLADYDRAARQHFNDYEITWDKRIRNVLWNQQALEAVISRATTDTELSKAIGILLTSTESHESVYKRLEEEMLDVIYTELADRAEPYRTAINERLATLFTSRTPLHEYANETLLNNDSKRLRAYIVVLAAELFGARRRNVIDFSSIYEIFHTASLIHDDIMDDSHQRRGRKPLHVKYGVDNAIVTGDLLLIKGYALIAQLARSEDISREQLLAMLEVIGESGAQCCLGQSLDLRMARERQYDDIEAYLNMIALKTGSLIAGATKFGAVLAGASNQQVATMERFGTHLGVAFQIVDDSLDLLGQQRAKKSLQSDLKEGKATPMLIRAIALASRAERESILQTVGDRNIDQTAVQRILKLYRRYDAIGYAQQLSHEYIQRARADLETLPNRDAKARFGEIVNALDYWSLLSDTEQ